MVGGRNDQAIVDALAALARVNEVMQAQSKQQGGADEFH